MNAKHLLTTHRGYTLAAVFLSMGLAHSGQAQENARAGRPIIDMHLHAAPAGQVLPTAVPNPVTGEPSPTSAIEHMRETLDMMERYNVVAAIVSGTSESTAAWHEAAPGRVLASLEMGRPGFDSSGGALPDLDDIAALYRDGAWVAMGEITAQYEGFALDDPGYEPYYALAEQLDVPVGVHTGTSFPGTAYRGKPDFRVALGNPILLEDVLVRHPGLRVYLMHGGYPWDREAQAIMQQYPQVYMDLSPLWLNAGNPDFERLLETEMRLLFASGLGERVMFGTDQMLWPESIGMAIEMIESSEFLSEQQKRDILYNNAARFLRLGEDVVAEHHGR